MTPNLLSAHIQSWLGMEASKAFCWDTRHTGPAGLWLPQFTQLWRSDWQLCRRNLTSGVCGFILACRDFLRILDHPFPTCAFFSFFFEVEIAHACWVLSLYQDQSTVAQQTGTTVAERSLFVSSFPDRFPHYARSAALSAISDFVGSWVYACLRVICHVHFWHNDRGVLHATAVTWGWNEHRISQHRKLTAQKVNSWEENSPATSARIWTHNLLITSSVLLSLALHQEGA